MLHVVPSEVVKAIDAAFPDPLDARLTPYDSHVVAGVVALAHRVPDAHLANRSADERRLFIQAIAICDDLLKAWATVEREQGMLGATPKGPMVVRLKSLGDRNPIEVIRSVLVHCPDDAPAVTVPELRFLDDPALSEVLKLDMGTAQTTLANGEFKAACVMAGSVVEALLLWALKRTTEARRDAAIRVWTADACATSNVPKTPLSRDCSEWSLAAMIEVARRIQPTPFVSKKLANALEAAKAFRNMIHPARAYETKPTRGAALIAVGAMLRTAEELGELVQATKL